VNDGSPQTAGLSGDHGWGEDADEAHPGPLRTALLLATSGAFWGVLWLMTGLAPLPVLASRLGWGSRANTSAHTAQDSIWRSKQV
jgi:hypothetical protein